MNFYQLSSAAAVSALVSGLSSATPVNLITGLTSITFYERSGGTAPNAFTYAVNSSQLTTRLSGTLSSTNSDFGGVPTEFYDVYYSNADGTFNLSGEYVSIEGVYGNTSPAGGGLNLAEMKLNFASTPSQYGNVVASYLALGDNAIPSSIGNTIDGNLGTHTTMGNTVGSTQRLRVTLGFEASSGAVPEPATLVLVSTAIAGIFVSSGRRKNVAGTLPNSGKNSMLPRPAIDA